MNDNERAVVSYLLSLAQKIDDGEVQDVGELVDGALDYLEDRR